MGKASNLISKISENFEEVTLNKFSDKEIEKELNEGLANLTMADIEAVEDDINEAKSTFPKNKQIKSLQALTKKLRAKLVPKRTRLTAISNKYSKAADRKAKLALTKERKAVQAEIDKENAIIKRANDQLEKLLKERKEYNKKNRASKK